MSAAAAMSPMRRRSTRSTLSMAARAFADALELDSPKPSDPGYWKTHDQFLSVNAGIVQKVRGRPEEQLRVLIAFDGRGLQNRCKDLLAEEFPNYEQMSAADKRYHWARMLQVGKQVRTERVLEIVRILHGHGVEVDPSHITVHRVSNTFSATVSPASLRRILELRKAGFEQLRRIQANKIVEIVMQ